MTFAILASQYPFDGQNREEIHQKIKSSQTKPKYELLNRYWQDGALAKDFIERCLDKNPASRWSAKRLLSHEWMKVMVDEPAVSDD